MKMSGNFGNKINFYSKDQIGCFLFQEQDFFYQKHVLTELTV